MKRGFRALLTGASGFLGSHLVQGLNEAGFVVAAIARPKSTISLGTDSRIAKVFQYTGETDQVCQAVRDCQPDVVFHLASLFCSEHSPDDIKGLVQDNILLGTQLLEGMRLAGVTAFVNTGTSWQNYAGPGYEPTNLYSATKQAFEDIVSFYVVAAQLRCITLRLFDTYGPHDPRKKLVSAMLQCLLTGTPLRMSPGEQIIDLLHVDDLTRAFLQAASLVREQKEAAAAVYEVSGGERLSLREIVALFEKASGRRLNVQFGARPYRDREVMVPWAGTSLPGWDPKISLVEGFSTLVANQGRPPINQMANLEGSELISSQAKNAQEETAEYNLNAQGQRKN